MKTFLLFSICLIYFQFSAQIQLGGFVQYNLNQGENEYTSIYHEFLPSLKLSVNKTLLAYGFELANNFHSKTYSIRTESGYGDLGPQNFYWSKHYSRTRTSKLSFNYIVPKVFFRFNFGKKKRFYTGVNLGMQFLTFSKESDSKLFLEYSYVYYGPHQDTLGNMNVYKESSYSSTTKYDDFKQFEVKKKICLFQFDVGYKLPINQKWNMEFQFSLGKKQIRLSEISEKLIKNYYYNANFQIGLNYCF